MKLRKEKNKIIPARWDSELKTIIMTRITGNQEIWHRRKDSLIKWDVYYKMRGRDKAVLIHESQPYPHEKVEDETLHSKIIFA